MHKQQAIVQSHSLSQVALPILGGGTPAGRLVNVTPFLKQAIDHHRSSELYRKTNKMHRTV